MPTIVSFMQHDHERLDKLFGEYQKEQSSNPAKKLTLFQEFRNGLEKHIKWEQEILFPIFEKKTGIPQGGPTEVMNMEHSHIKTFLENIGERLQKNERTNDVDENLILTLRQHNYKEENILYPSIDGVISASETKEILEKMK